MTLDSAGSAPGPALGAGAFSVPCQWPEGALCLEVLLQGQTSGLMLVDASAAHTVLNLPAVERAGIPLRKELIRPCRLDPRSSIPYL